MTVRYASPDDHSPPHLIKTNRPQGLFWHLGYLCAKYKWIVFAFWMLILVGTTVGSSALGGAFNAQFKLSNSSSQIGTDLFKSHVDSSLPTSNTISGSIVLHISSVDALNIHAADIKAAMTSIRGLNTVKNISDPFNNMSPSHQVAIADITYKDTVTSLDTSDVAAIDTAVKMVRADGILVDYTGDLGNTAGSSSNTSSELIGIAVAIIILLFAFGSIIATLTPIMSAIIGIFCGIGVLGMLSASFQFPNEAPTLALMMGLGVGIDYALFLSTRFRQYIIDKQEPLSAVASTVASSGRAVVIAASTVVISLIGLYASGIIYIGQLGVSASITVTVAALAAITLVPALLAIAGRRIDILKVRHYPVAEPTHKKTQWFRFANKLSKHPIIYLCSALIFLIILALPLVTIQTGTPGVRALPIQSTERKASDAIDAGFGVGYQAQLVTVVRLSPGQSDAQLQALSMDLRDRLTHTSGIASVTPFIRSKDGIVLVGRITPTTSLNDTATISLVHLLNDKMLPDILSGKGTAYVTGRFASLIALQEAVSSSLPIIISTVVIAAMILLLISFRSPLLAIKAGVVNLISIGASYGILVAVFQWGWGSSLFGVPGPVPIVSYVPMLMFAIIFGLSMDYEVFLLSRIRESWEGGASNQISVAHGLSVTARIISCAAVIMACVFFSFVLSPSITIKMLAFGLGVSVIIDMTVVRLIIVPCTMFLLDRANWWTPRWLDRILPRLNP